eukprot:7221405-Prymnesium_polylepis.1
MRVVTGAPKQAEKASPYESKFVSSMALSPRTVTRMSSSFFECSSFTERPTFAAARAFIWA